MDMNAYPFREVVLGTDITVPIIGGSKVNYINFDNAATTPPFKRAMESINGFSQYYSNIHRGSGFKSEISSIIYEETKETILDFIGSNSERNHVIFTKNSTEALNKLANCMHFESGDVVISTQMEHHSNDLPWRKKAQVMYVEVFENGELDLDHYMYLLNIYNSKVKLVTVSAASNVTGFINPIHKMAKMAHRYGIRILIDASQIMAHRKLDVKPDWDEEHLDFVVFTGHKMYAPFGIGVLIGPKEFFDMANPDMLGGGIVKVVLSDTVYLADSPERHEAGTPNILGAVGLASAIKVFESIGDTEVIRHENELVQHLLSGLMRLENISIYGSVDSDPLKRVGTVSFNMGGTFHALVAAILSYEYGIGVRNGCFCAHPYVLSLLNVGKQMQSEFAQHILNGNKSQVPGMVRVSLGLYNTINEVDILLLALKNIKSGTFNQKYVFDESQGTYKPKDWNINIHDYFKI